MPNRPQFVDPSTATLNVSQRDPRFYLDPYAVYAELHELGRPVYWENIGHWCFAGYETVNALLRDRRFGRQILHVATRDEAGLPDPQPHLADFEAAEAHSLLELEPPAHTRLRGLVNRAFVSRQIDGLRPEIAALAHRLIDSFAGDHHVELISRYAETIPVTIIARMLGVPTEDAPQLLAWSHRMVRMYLFERTREDEIEANRASREFSSYLRERIASKRQQPDEDLLSHMIAAQIDGEHLSEAELVSTTILLLNAGHEATVHQIGNAVKTLLSEGVDTKTVFADPQSTALAVEECLRFAPPLHLFLRYVLSDLEFEGIKLRKGEQVALLLAAANRDSRRFSAPNRFDPTRREGHSLSFGAGLHFCIGAPLARLELQTALPILFDRLPSLELAGTAKIRDSFHFHGLERLDLVW